MPTGFEGGGVRCPIGSTVTFDGSSDDLKSRRGDLKSSMMPRDLLRGPGGSIGGARGSRGASNLGDPLGPRDWFDESSDDS